MLGLPIFVDKFCRIAFNLEVNVLTSRIMDKLYRLIILAVSVAALSSCSDRIGDDEEGMTFVVRSAFNNVLDSNGKTVVQHKWNDNDRIVAVVDGEFCRLNRLGSGWSFGTASFVPAEGDKYMASVVKSSNVKLSQEIDGVRYPVVNIPAPSGNVLTQKGSGSTAHLGSLPWFGGAVFFGGDKPEVSMNCASAVFQINIINDGSSAISIKSAEIECQDLALSGSFAVNAVDGVFYPQTVSSKSAINVSDCSVKQGGNAVLNIPVAGFTPYEDVTAKLSVTLENETIAFPISLKSGESVSAGSVMSVQLKLSESGEGIDDGKGGNINGYLVNYEIPKAKVSLGAGEPHSSFVSETNGGAGAKAYIYETGVEGTRIVTHTFVNANKQHRNYTFLYDYQKRCPIWLVYHLNSGFCATSGHRSNSWTYDPAIPTDAQPNLSSSYDAPYNRGHMLASHSRAGVTNANRQTFYFTNMAPQNSSNFNTGGAVWNELEDAEKSIVPSGRDTLYVATGCIFDSGYRIAEDASGNECAVPTRFYKALMMCKFDNSGKLQSATSTAFLMPHETDGKTKNYNKYEVTVDALEEVLGYDLFTNVPASIQEQAEAKCGLSL